MNTAEFPGSFALHTISQKPSSPGQVKFQVDIPAKAATPGRDNFGMDAERFPGSDDRRQNLATDSGRRVVRGHRRHAGEEGTAGGMPPPAQLHAPSGPDQSRTRRTQEHSTRHASDNVGFAAAPQVDQAVSGFPDEDEYEDVEMARKYGAEHVVKLFIPVSICMLLVVIVVKTIEFYTRRDGFLIYTPFQENTDDTVTKLWMSVANMFIFITVVAVMTFVLFFLFKYRCYRFLHGWLVFSSITILFMFLFIFFAEILEAYNVTVDYITLAVVMWNVAIVGILTIHWRGPLLLQQAYLILVSVLMALIFIKYLPDWTTWTILAGISVWDLIAVLTTCGPLRKLVELAQQRNETIFPSLIYTSGIMYMAVGPVRVAATPALLPTTLHEADDIRKNRQMTPGKSEADEAVSRNTRDMAYAVEHEARSFLLQSHKRKSVETELPVGADFDADENNAARSSNNNSNNGRQANDLNAERNVQPQPTDGDYDNISPSRRITARDNVRNNREPRQLATEEGAEAPLRQPDDADAAAQRQEDEGIKLGLGDFIFYSVLVGKASSKSDWTTIVACYAAILIGLCLTLVLLAIHQRALPALPISLSLGLIFYFLTSLVMKPFLDELAANQVFV